ncbi:MAG: hypothetical protein ABI895_14785 [Deltaproteobacteria bacterium]
MTLEIYPVVLQLVRRLSPYLPALRARSVTLGDQLERALISIPLQSCGGRLQSGQESPRALSVRRGSARDALACLETAEALGWIQPLEPELAALFHRVMGTLVRLVVPRRGVAALGARPRTAGASPSSEP